MNADREAALDRDVRYYVYEHVTREGLPPTIDECAAGLSRSPVEIRASFRRLADGHVLVLQQPTGEILMAYPFSAVPTAFRVKVGERSYYGNCIWDALGIPAMLKRDAAIEASCGCCRTAMNLRVADGSLENAKGMAHFAIPASRWWDNVVFT